MPRLEYRGILARPRAYTYKNGTEIKSWEELRRAFQRTQELKLTLGHPMTPDHRFRPVNADDYLGRVIPVINEEHQVIEGIFKFHDEEWERVPPHIRNKIVNDEAIEISAGFVAETNEQGVQTGMVYDHIAILADGENPVCPLGECGINVRLESDNGEDITIMRYEQATSTKDEPEGEANAPEKTEKADEPAAAREPATVTFTKEQFKELLEAIRPPEPSGDVKEDTEEEPDQTEEVETEEAPPREPSLEPERAFPAGSPASKQKSPYLNDDGSVAIPSDIYLGGTSKKKE